MNTIDKQLLGSNFNEMSCTENTSIIHPETCVDSVLIANESETSLSEWFGNNTLGSFADYSSMLEWLQENYPITPYTLPNATNSRLGGVKINTDYLTINNGILSVNINALDIPQITPATYSTIGSLKLGNSTLMSTNFQDSIISGQLSDDYIYNGHVYTFPLRLDVNSRAGIAIPTNLFGSTGSAVSTPWTFDWSKYKTTYDTSIVPTGGTATNYILLGNKNTNTNNGNLGYDDQAASTSVNYGYPRFALVAGTGISFTRYTNTFASSNPWNTDLTEIVISAESSGSYELPVASSYTLGGVKVGFTDNQEDKAVQLDANNKAFVDVSNPRLQNHVVTDATPVVYDKYDHVFNTYQVQCTLSGEELDVVNIHDFITLGDGYNISYTQDINNKTFVWRKTDSDTGCYAGILYAQSLAAKGLFRVTIENDTTGVTEVHTVGFLMDTPPNPAYAIFTTLPWTVIPRQVGNLALYLYMQIPDEFVGTIKVNPVGMVAYSGTVFGSFEALTGYSWTSTSWTTQDVLLTTSLTGNALVTPQTYNGHIVVPTNPTIDTDAFVNEDTMIIGTTIYDSTINDYVMHSLVNKVKALTFTVQQLVTRLNNLNVQFVAES